MRRSSSTCVELAVAIAIALLIALVPRVAAAQACCASPSGFAPARLRAGEDALVGIVSSAGYVSGSWGRDRTFAISGPGTREVDLSQRLVVAWAPWERAELSFALPFVETHRVAGSVSDWGGGIGDARVGSRWTLSQLGMTRGVPRIQILSSVVLATGTAGDAATRPLATDATGTGAFQWENGLAVEQTFGRFLVSLNGAVAWRAPRTIRGVDTQLGPLFAGFVAVSYSFPNQLSLGVTAAYEASLGATRGGALVPDSSTARPTLGASAAMPITKGLRATAGLSWTPHVDGLGKNEVASVTGTVGLIWAWGKPSSCPMHPTTPDCGCPH